MPAQPPKSLVPLLVLGIWMPAAITLYFLAGRLSMQPFPSGVREMPAYGCCSQGLVFPRHQLDPLIQRLRSPALKEHYPDQIIEAVAGERLAKWALVPSVLQHVGRKGSSTALPGSVKQTWNFQFELGE
jgi:hypothetical protein